jgi:glycosyltransferase involved in cell wall biosynthesis
MKASILSFGHVDVILPLANQLANDIDLELVLVFAQNKKKESVINFEQISVRTGFLDEDVVKIILGERILSYLNPKLKVRIFIYSNLKLRSFKNFLLSIRFSCYLRQFDLIHINGQNAVVPLMTLLLIKKRFVFSIHDLQEHSSERKRQRMSFNETNNRFILKSRHQVILQNKSAFNFACSKYSRSNNTINYLPFGELDIYTQFLPKDLNPEFKSDILFFGRISAYKGIEYLIEAFRIVKKNYPNLKLIIAGSGKLYFESNLADNDSSVKVINRYITNEELASLISQTRIIVCPYTDATQSGVAMTAFAFNKPVIATDTGGFPDIIIPGKTGFLVPVRDAENLANAIIKILQNPFLEKELSEKIRNFMQTSEFSWASITQKMQSIYQKAMRN